MRVAGPLNQLQGTPLTEVMTATVVYVIQNLKIGYPGNQIKKIGNRYFSMQVDD